MRFRNFRLPDRLASAPAPFPVAAGLAIISGVTAPVNYAPARAGPPF
jgi:hypothetical protein